MSAPVDLLDFLSAAPASTQPAEPTASVASATRKLEATSDSSSSEESDSASSSSSSEEESPPPPRSRKHSTSAVVKPFYPPAAPCPSAPASAPASAPVPGDDDSFDLTSGLRAEESNREFRFAGGEGDEDDLWDALARGRDAADAAAAAKRNGTANPVVHLSPLPPSTNASLRIEPDSMFYSANKKLDELSARLDKAAGHAIDSINGVQSRRGSGSGVASRSKTDPQ